MSDNMQTPPEKCPVCGAGPNGKGFENSQRIIFDCWAVFDNGWIKPCPHAFTAALRCGATLHPTPLELARQALADAAVAVANAMPATRDFPENDDAYAALTNAQIELDRLAEAYRALLEPRP